MSDTLIKDFLLSKAPANLPRMEEPLFPLCDYPIGTNLHFIFQLCLEADSILDRGDSLFDPVSFTRQDYRQLLRCHNVLRRALSADHVDADAHEAFRQTPDLMDRIGSYHSQKIDSSHLDKIRVLEEEERGIAVLGKALGNRDFDAVLDMVPDKASLVYDDGDTDVPAREPGSVSLVRVKMARKFAAAFDHEPAFMNLIAPEAVEVEPEYLRRLSADAERNIKVLWAIKSLGREMRNIINGTVPRRPVVCARGDNVVSFLSGQKYACD